MKKNSLYICIGSLMVLAIALWGYGHLEAYCFFWPSIDTKFSPGFSEQTFGRIKTGMPGNEVKNALGKPLSTEVHKEGTEEWLYTGDGKCWWGDFAWLYRSVTISNGIVAGINRSVRYD